MPDQPTHAAIEVIIREHYARLLSFLVSRTGGDFATAEDVLSDALVAALKQWPVDGVPQRPEAWLLTAARRRLIDLQRRSKTRSNSMIDLDLVMKNAECLARSPSDFPDDRLKLLFVCAHPAIDSASRTPLMLQTVLGLSVDRIASAFLMSPSAMRQRLVRAKTKIRDSNIAFVIPAENQWSDRIMHVLDAIYTAYAAGWIEPCIEPDGDQGVTSDAIWLAQMLTTLIPSEPESFGLLALLLYCQSRRAARNVEGEYIPLHEQDTSRWDDEKILAAETALAAAAKLNQPGRFQLEAAIQSVHAQRAVTGTTNWMAIAYLYESLLAHTSAIGAKIGHAIAIGHQNQLNRWDHRWRVLQLQAIG